jgi:DNA invertase Pin-like site-specific DNA recombinase
MAKSSLFGRRIHLSGSVSQDPAIATVAEVTKARALVEGLVQELMSRGATFVLPVDSEKTRTADGTPILFDWLIWETIRNCLASRPSGAPDPLVIAVQHHKTEDQIPPQFQALWDELRSSDLIQIENVSHWNMNSKRMEAQARWGDILLTVGGSEGVLFLANLYHDAGKPVLPLNCKVTPVGEGARRLFTLGLSSAQAPRLFRTVAQTSHTWMNRINFTDRADTTGQIKGINSLDAQHDAASAYIKSQAHAGWTLIRSRYDDGGYSGGSTDRPDLQRLLDDIRARKLDVIVVYKVDRLTRSLADFAKLVELFDAHGVSFVSVTQQFNTTTSMGRLTLNVLLSFAQFEREVTSERIRDKIAASKRKGLWVGGPLPLGYHMRDDKIAVVEGEAERVRLIYRRYLELGGVNALVRDLREREFRTKSRLLATGATRGGVLFGRGSLFYLLRNRFYVGEVKYKDEILPGEQPVIMDRALFDAVQQKLTDQWTTRSTTRNASDHLLTGFCSTMSVIAWFRPMQPRPAFAIAITSRFRTCMENPKLHQSGRSPVFRRPTSKASSLSLSMSI